MNFIFFSGGQFGPVRGGQFAPVYPGQFAPVWGGQFEPVYPGQLKQVKGGQLPRFLHCKYFLLANFATILFGMGFTRYY